MIRCLTKVVLCGITICCLVEKPMCRLPKPHYQRDASDPDWLAYAAQFHGHLGPWATAGLRAGMAARHAVDADGYFDVRVTAQGPFDRPPRSCFLDGLQVATGATLGKRNLEWVKSDQIMVRVENTRTGKVVEVRPTAALMKLVAVVKPRPHSYTDPDGTPQYGDARKGEDRAEPSLETVARRIAAMPEREILAVTSPARK